MSMVKHFRDMLAAGELPEDPFDLAVKRSVEQPTEGQKEAYRRFWNNRIALHYGGEAALRQRMHTRRAARTLRRKLRR